MHGARPTSAKLGAKADKRVVHELLKQASERNMPVTVVTADKTHQEAVAGYDPVRGVVLVRDTRTARDTPWPLDRFVESHSYVEIGRFAD